MLLASHTRINLVTPTAVSMRRCLSSRKTPQVHVKKPPHLVSGVEYGRLTYEQPQHASAAATNGVPAAAATAYAFQSVRSVKLCAEWLGPDDGTKCCIYFASACCISFSNGYSCFWGLAAHRSITQSHHLSRWPATSPSQQQQLNAYTHHPW
jgi:hypothetical protein